MAKCKHSSPLVSLCTMYIAQWTCVYIWLHKCASLCDAMRCNARWLMNAQAHAQAHSLFVYFAFCFVVTWITPLSHSM